VYGILARIEEGRSTSKLLKSKSAGNRFLGWPGHRLQEKLE
jgi:hypothetical protein